MLFLISVLDRWAVIVFWITHSFMNVSNWLLPISMVVLILVITLTSIISQSSPFNSQKMSFHVLQRLDTSDLPFFKISFVWFQFIRDAFFWFSNLLSLFYNVDIILKTVNQLRNFRTWNYPPLQISAISSQSNNSVISFYTFLLENMIDSNER